MESPVFSRLAGAIQAPSKSKEWFVSFPLFLVSIWEVRLTPFAIRLNRFSMAEQAVNTIYTLGDQPDALCSEILRQMTEKVFGVRTATKEKKEDSEEGEEEKEDGVEEPETMQEEEDKPEQDASQPDETQPQSEPQTGNAFELSQLIFVAGHCAIKQLVHLELVERDLKRRKAEEDKSKGGKKGSKEDDELDQVAGSVEDEIGDTIAIAREKELMYGPTSLLQVFGPMSATIVSQPKVYRVSFLFFLSPSWRATTHPRSRVTEPDAQDCRNSRTIEVYVCLFGILRRTPHAPLQDPRNLSRTRSSIQHCHRSWRYRRLLLDDYGRKLGSTLRWTSRQGSHGQEEHFDGAHSSHLERYDQSQGSTGRNGKVFE